MGMVTYKQDAELLAAVLGVHETCDFKFPRYSTPIVCGYPVSNLKPDI